MDDWKALIDQAMQIETTDTIGAHGLYEQGVRAALAQSQMLLGVFPNGHAAYESGRP